MMIQLSDTQFKCPDCGTVYEIFDPVEDKACCIKHNKELIKAMDENAQRDQEGEEWKK